MIQGDCARRKGAVEPGLSRLRPDVIFGDIWCLFVSFGPAPHIYQRGERVGEPVCTIHGHYPDSTWSSVRLASEVPGNMPHPVCLHIDPAARSGTEGEPHPETRAVGAN